jgi:glycosyltransferase involved in cell wall biosynthesis
MKILYFAPEDWAFVSHFRPMAQAARACGLDVVIATRVHRHAEVIRGDGYKLVPLQSQRGRLDPLGLLKSVMEMARIIRAEEPTIVHCVSLPLAILGGVAAQAMRQRTIVLAVTGLGFAWIERGMVPALLRATARVIVRLLLRHRGTVCVFENSEDPRELGLALNDPKVTLVGGAGVDPDAYPCGAEPAAPPVRVAVLARMIKPKGIAESVAAIAHARALGANVELDLYGVPDSSNPTSYTEADLQRWAAVPGINWHGASADVARVLCEHHIVMLLSAREGLPRCLVEAAAAGRPIVASDVAGCREVVRDGYEGYLVPFGDVDATASALIALAGDPALRRRFGAAANARFHARFTATGVKAVFADLYRALIAGREEGFPRGADPAAPI